MPTIIVAYNQKRVIGAGNKIPWYLPEDLKLFKARTVGHSVVMGRKTWDSIVAFNSRGKAGKKASAFRLSDRVNYVVTSSAKELRERYVAITDARCGPFFVENLEGILGWTELNKEKTYIIGGESIYREALERGYADRVIASEVDDNQDGDKFFPELGDEWHPMAIDVHEGFRVVEYHRKG